MFKKILFRRNDSLQQERKFATSQGKCEVRFDHVAYESSLLSGVEKMRKAIISFIISLSSVCLSVAIEQFNSS